MVTDEGLVRAAKTVGYEIGSGIVALGILLTSGLFAIAGSAILPNDIGLAMFLILGGLTFFLTTFYMCLQQFLKR